MKISNLKNNTKLMWDAPGHTYPAIVGNKHDKNEWVMVHCGHSSQWMGPDSEYLREPTKDELNTITWPEKTIHYH